MICYINSSLRITPGKATGYYVVRLENHILRDVSFPRKPDSTYYMECRNHTLFVRDQKGRTFIEGPIKDNTPLSEPIVSSWTYHPHIIFKGDY